MSQVASAAPDRSQTPLQKWWATVGVAIGLQWAVVLAASLVAALVAGAVGARSALGGGGAVALANTVLAVWLTLKVARVGVLSPAAMLGGEMAKLGLTVALLIAVANQFKPLSWMALIVGVIAALKAQWLAVWFTRKI